MTPAADGERLPSAENGHPWLVAWHPPAERPGGRRHGAAGICVDPAGSVVLVSPDGQRWDFPAGRPEDDETDEETLRREMWEEARARVVRARLVGYVYGQCLDGPERGLTLCRSVWRADVDVAPWRPEHEIAHRRLVTPAGAAAVVRRRDEAWTRIGLRMLVEAGLG